MRAGALTDVGEFEVQERERPEPQAGEVPEVGACGVCMTDFHMYHGTFTVDTPQVLGHESAGTVAEVGDGVVGIEVGDRVAMNPTVPCNTCSACKAGRHTPSVRTIRRSVAPARPSWTGVRRVRPRSRGQRRTDR